VKGETPPEFHGCCGLNQTLCQLPVTLMLPPTTTVASSRSLSLSDQTASYESVSSISYCTIYTPLSEVVGPLPCRGERACMSL
jgi:hypothetical protein